MKQLFTVDLQAGESDQALDVLEIMENNGVEPDAVTYGTLMKACEGEGAFSIMRSLMDEMDQKGARNSQRVEGARQRKRRGVRGEVHVAGRRRDVD